jgi:hypothetical protein
MTDDEPVIPIKRERVDGPLKHSLRPSKHAIETMILSSNTTTAKEGTPWSVDDDVRLIRLEGCQKLRWAQIREYFPNRKNNSAEQRYTYYLRCYKVGANFA